MKTTIDLPDALLHKAKVAAAQRRTTLKQLVVEGLHQVLHQPQLPSGNSPTTAPESSFFETDAHGVPVLKRRGVVVTEDWIEKLREEEGI